MTDNVIKKALEWHSNDETHCGGCPYKEHSVALYCVDMVMRDALDLINRQQAEVEKLKDSRDRWKRNALSFDEASRETEKELEKLYAEIDRLQAYETLYEDVNAEYFETINCIKKIIVTAKTEAISYSLEWLQENEYINHSPERRKQLVREMVGESNV